MSHRILQITVLAGLLSMAAVPAWTHPARHRTFGPRAHARELGEAARELRADRLDLTAEQRTQLRDLRREARREAVLRHGEMARLRARLHAEMMAQELDAVAVRALAEEMGKHVAEATEARLTRHLAELEVLTAKQREALQEMREQTGEMRERRHEMREHRGDLRERRHEIRARRESLRGLRERRGQRFQ